MPDRDGLYSTTRTSLLPVFPIRIGVPLGTLCETLNYCKRSRGELWTCYTGFLHLLYTTRLSPVFLLGHNRYSSFPLVMLWVRQRHSETRSRLEDSRPSKHIRFILLKVWQIVNAISHRDDRNYSACRLEVMIVSRLVEVPQGVRVPFDTRPIWAHSYSHKKDGMVSSLILCRRSCIYVIVRVCT